MRLTTIALAPLFWALSLATITLEPVPSELRAGSEYYIKWNQTRDYVSSRTPNRSLFGEIISTNLRRHQQRLWNFDLTVLTREKDGDEWYKNVRVVDHMLDFEVGAHEIYWKVPAFKDNGLVLFPLLYLHLG